MKPKLVIVNTAQFGYHIDTFYYCKYLKQKYNVIYISWDQGLPKIEMADVRVVYVNRGKGIGCIFHFVRQVLEITHSSETIIFIKYFKLVSSLIRLLRARNPLVLDIRSGAVERNFFKRLFLDALLRIELKCFKNITVISQSLAHRFGLNEKAYILPLGADIISDEDKKFDEVLLLYVGTLYNRNIKTTLLGFSKFYKENKSTCKIKYTIIGDGLGDEVEELNELVKKMGLEEVINIVGRVPHDKLKVYFDTHNIGISYIPLTPYYDVQPATKTFEYLLSGMPVLATATYENKLVINQRNGVLTGDSPDDFVIGLVDIYQKCTLFNSGLIRRESLKYTWKKIIMDLVDYLEAL